MHNSLFAQNHFIFSSFQPIFKESKGQFSKKRYNDPKFLYFITYDKGRLYGHEFFVPEVKMFYNLSHYRQVNFEPNRSYTSKFFLNRWKNQSSRYFFANRTNIQHESCFMMHGNFLEPNLCKNSFNPVCTVQTSHR